MYDAHMHSSHAPDFTPSPEGIYLSCAAGPEDWQALMEESRQGIQIFLGIHPQSIPEDSLEIHPLLESLNECLNSCPAAGVGECGLDRRFYKKIPRRVQEEVLRAQLQMAGHLNRPLNLHQIKSAGALAEILEDETPDVPLIIHGFKGKPETAKRFLKLGAYLSLGPGRQWEDWEFKELVKKLPRNHILLESDWPYAPPPYTKTMNELYENAAGVLGIDRDELLAIVKNNGKIFTN